MQLELKLHNYDDVGQMHRKEKELVYTLPVTCRRHSGGESTALPFEHMVFQCKISHRISLKVEVKIAISVNDSSRYERERGRD